MKEDIEKVKQNLDIIKEGINGVKSTLGNIKNQINKLEIQTLLQRSRNRNSEIKLPKIYVPKINITIPKLNLIYVRRVEE